jgi:hypothetical protein
MMWGPSLQIRRPNICPGRIHCKLEMGFIYSATKWKPRISENINPIISNRVTIYLVYHIMVSNATVMKIHKLMELFFKGAA